MLLIFYNQRTVGQRSYVILETHATHKIREPLPHGITVKPVSYTHLQNLLLVNAFRWVVSKDKNGDPFLK